MRAASRLRLLRKKPVLDRAVAYWRADAYDADNDWLTDLTGRGHNAQLGSTSGVDTNDPLILRYEGEQYLYLPGGSGNYASTPDAAPLDITGDIDIEVRFSMDDIIPSTTQSPISKYKATDDERSWYLYISAAGTIHFYWTPDGTSGNAIDELIDAPGWSAGTPFWLRVTLDVDDGAGNYLLTYYWSAEQTNDPDAVTWISLGTDTGVATTSINSGMAPLEIGGRDDGVNSKLIGKVYRARVKDGIDGTVEFDADFTQQSTAPYATFTEGSSNAATVTINHSAAGRKAIIVDRTVLLFGTDDFCEVADHPDLNFALADSFTVVYVGRNYKNDPAANETFLAKKSDSGNGAGYELYSRATAAVDWTPKVSDGAATVFDLGATISEGVASVYAFVRDRVADDLESFDDGVGTGTPGSDGLTGSSTTSRTLAIGAINVNVTPTEFNNGEFFAAALFREALSDADVRAVGAELGFVSA